MRCKGSDLWIIWGRVWADLVLGEGFESGEVLQVLSLFSKARELLGNTDASDVQNRFCDQLCYVNHTNPGKHTCNELSFIFCTTLAFLE